MSTNHNATGHIHYCNQRDSVVLAKMMRSLLVMEISVLLNMYYLKPTTMLVGWNCSPQQMCCKTFWQSVS